MGLRVVKNTNVKVSKNLDVPVETGKHHRLLCLTGKNKGLAYFMTGKRLVMGRSDTCDIQILDTKSSREHAELTKVGEKYVVTDLGSQNGIVINDLKVNQHTLSNGDKVIVGQTVFKYSIFNNQAPTAIDEDFNEDDEEDDDEDTQNAKKPANKRILILVAAIVAIFFLFDGAEPPPKPKAAPIANVTGVSQGAADTSRDMDTELTQKVDTILHRGLREYREANYFRAIEEFNLALILNPRSGRAAFYLEKSKQKMDEDIKANFLRAKVAIDALKYDSAEVSYCAILRLLEKYPEDERFVKAKKELEDLLEKMGKQKNETNCL